MTLTQHAALDIDQGDRERPTVFEPECHGGIDPVGGIPLRIKIDGALDSKQTGNGQTGALHHALVSADLVADAA
jgi:hypothetical protein